MAGSGQKRPFKIPDANVGFRISLADGVRSVVDINSIMAIPSQWLLTKDRSIDEVIY